MKLKRLNEIPMEISQLAGTRDTTLQWVVTKNDGAKHYAMRVFTIQPGGEIPLHTHENMEHEIFILEGEAILYDGISELVVKKDDALLIQPNEKHSFINRSAFPFRFICVVPII